MKSKIFVLSFIILFGGLCKAATLTVGPSFTPGPTTFNRIQEAVDAANVNDLIEVHPGDYFESIEIREKPLTIRAVKGPLETRVLGEGTGFDIDNRGSGLANLPVTIEGFTISKTQDGISAIFGTTNVRNCIVTTPGGTGVLNADSITQCVLSFCDIGVSGGISRNCIFFENGSPGGTGEYNCYWPAGPSGVNQIVADPLFRDPSNLAFPDFRLKPGSPCIDAGDIAIGNLDPDGTRNDMGVFGGPLSASFWFAPVDGPTVRDVRADPMIIERGQPLTIQGVAEFR